MARVRPEAPRPVPHVTAHSLVQRGWDVHLYNLVLTELAQGTSPGTRHGGGESSPLGGTCVRSPCPGKPVFEAGLGGLPQGPPCNPRRK